MAVQSNKIGRERLLFSYKSTGECFSNKHRSLLSVNKLRFSGMSGFRLWQQCLVLITLLATVATLQAQVTYTDGDFQVFIGSANTDGSGVVDTGFTAEVTTTGRIVVTDFDPTVTAAVPPNAVGIATFTNGTITFTEDTSAPFSGNADTASFVLTAAGAFTSGTPGPATGINITPGADTANGYEYEVLFSFTTPITAFGFDLIDIIDTPDDGEDILRYEFFIDGQSIGFIQDTAFGAGVGGDPATPVDVFNSAGVLQGTVGAGQNFENFVGFTGASLVSNFSLIVSTATDPGDGFGGDFHGIDTVSTTTDLADVDLGITKDDGAISYVSGVSQNITYTITVDNNGPTDLPVGAVVTDTLPLGTTFVSSTLTDADTRVGCVDAGAVVTCTLGALPNGGSSSFEIIINVPASFTGDLVNTVIVQPTDGATDTDLTNTDLEADINLIKTGVLNDGGDGIVNAGDTIDYTFIATNSGDVVLTDVEVTDPLPGLSALSCTPVQPATLAIGANLTCTATLSLNQTNIDIGVVNNTAAVNGTTPDADTATDTDDDTQTIPTSAVLAASKTVTDANGNGIAEPGEVLTYTILINNTGNIAADNSLVQDLVNDANITSDPAQVLTITNASDFIPAIPTIATLQAGFTLDIAPGATASIIYTVIVNDPIVFGDNSFNKFLINVINDLSIGIDAYKNNSGFKACTAKNCTTDRGHA